MGKTPITVSVRRPCQDNTTFIERTRTEMRKRHYGLRTEDAYLSWIERFIRFHRGRHPGGMGEAEVETFLSYLATDRKVAAATQNQALGALLFLFRDILGVRLGWIENIVHAKGPRRLPVVLTRQEVQAILSRLGGAKWLAALLMYGAGLRLLECLRLRVKGVDFGYRQITIRGGKGNKDRVTVLPAAAEERMRDHLDQVKQRHETDLKNGGAT